MDWTLPSTKKIWNLCGLDIFTVALSWLDTSLFPPPPQINQTSIVLIPKISNPTSMKDLKPISLCNVLYKIISQTLANHLNPLLHKCISLKQFFFLLRDVLSLTMSLLSLKLFTTWNVSQKEKWECWLSKLVSTKTLTEFTKVIAND